MGFGFWPECGKAAGSDTPAPKRRRVVSFHWADMPTVVCDFTTGGGFHFPVSASDFGL